MYGLFSRRHRADRSSRQRHWHHHGGGMRMGRFLDHGDLRFVILALIKQTPRHGYDLIKSIGEATGGAYSPSAGAIYPTLTLLEEMGWAEVSQAGDGRKLYTITAQGEAALEANRPLVDAVLARMADVKADQAERPAPELLEAFEALKAALNAKAGRGGLTAEAATAVREALFEATRKIIEACAGGGGGGGVGPRRPAPPASSGSLSSPPGDSC
jgi:DNA-binding PadR family transcriptional regulator